MRTSLKAIITVFICVVSHNIINAAPQNVNINIDSLRKDLKNLTLNIDDTAYVQLKYLIGHESKIFRGGYWDTIISECNQIRKTKNDSKIQQATKKVLSSSLLNRGLLLKFEGNYPKAMEYYFKSLDIAIEINDKSTQAYCYNNIGRVHIDLGDEDMALKYYKLSLKLKLDINDLSGIAESYNNMGVIYDKKGEKEKAINYYEKCLEIHKDIGNKEGEAYISNNLGAIYQKINPKLALDYFLRCLEIREEIGDKKGIAHVYSNLGNYYLEKEDYNKSLTYYEEGLAISQELGYPYLIEIHAQKLSNIYEKQGKLGDALKMYKVHITLRDSINNESNQKAAAKQEAKHEYEKQKVLDDAKHDKLLAIEQEEKEKQQILTGATAFGLGLVGIFLLVVFNRLKVTRKQKTIIETQKAEVEKQKEVVELAHHELEEKNQEIMDSIIYAKRIQSAILPPAKLVKQYLQESFILYKPKDIVAGDFYWLESVAPTGNKNETTILFAAADCTGHGVPGAMVSVVCHNAMNRAVREFRLINPGEILNKTREIVITEFEKSEDDVKDGMDIALCSLEGTTLKYAGAHNPLWIIRDGQLLETKANKQPIGLFDNPEPYTTHTIALEKGDTFYIFSDGYADQFGGEKGKKFKTANFKKLLLSIQSEPMEKQKQLINEAFENWKGNLEQLDDVCIIGVKV